METTRKRLGKLHALGKTKNYKHYYEAFKEEIDSELNISEVKPKGRPKKEPVKA